jgi:hypothetical protein
MMALDDRNIRLLPIPALLLALSLFLPCGAAAGSDISVRVVGDEEVVFRWATDRCNDNDIPDAPARAFRDDRGHIRLAATHYDDRLFTMVDGKPKRVDCRLALDSPDDPDPSHYRDHRWIAATWTDDGNKVHALVHHEYQGHRHPGACTLKDYTSCWYNSITYAWSDDGGSTFHQSEPPAVVAAAPFRQDVGQGRHRGFFSPTNIIKLGPYWYALIYTTGWEGQGAGMCVFRTPDIAQPAQWRAWDGKAFESRFADPYLAAASSNEKPTCKPVTGNWFGSLQRIDGTDQIIAVYLHEKVAGEVRSWQLAYSLSRDLLTWSPPVDLKPLPYFGSHDCKDMARYGYPSLIDMGEASRNFDAVGGSAELYLTRFNLKDCRNSFDRDLVRYKIKIELGR